MAQTELDWRTIHPQVTWHGEFAGRVAEVAKDYIREERNIPANEEIIINSFSMDLKVEREPTVEVEYRTVNHSEKFKDLQE